MDKVFEIEPLENFVIVCEKVLQNLYKSKQTTCVDVEPEPHIIQAAKVNVQKLLLNCNFEINRVSEVLKNKDWNVEKIECFVSLLEKRKTEIIFETLTNHNSKYGETLSDFDWNVKLIMGTNDLKTLSYPLMQLTLFTTSCGEQKTISFDFNKDMLASLINLLENIDTIQQYFLVLFSCLCPSI